MFRESRNCQVRFFMSVRRMLLRLLAHIGHELFRSQVFFQVEVNQQVQLDLEEASPLFELEYQIIVSNEKQTYSNVIFRS